MLRSLIVFVLVLMGLNLLAFLLGLPFHISIIGSLVLSFVVGGIMEMTRRR